MNIVHCATLIKGEKCVKQAALRAPLAGQGRTKQQDILAALKEVGSESSIGKALASKGVIGPSLAREVLQPYLGIQFVGGRHARRLEKIRAMENTQ